MLDKCWPTVFDVDPALNQHWLNISCLLGMHAMQNQTAISLNKFYYLHYLNQVSGYRKFKLRNWVIQDGRLAQFASCWKGELRCKLLHLWSKTLNNDCPNGHITTKYTIFILYYSWLQSIMMLACQTQVKGFVSDNRGYWWHYRSHSNRAWLKGIVFTPTNQQYMEIVIIMIVILSLSCL